MYRARQGKIAVQLDHFTMTVITYCIKHHPQGKKMKLFYTKGACSLVVRIIINEMGLQAEYEAVDLKTKKTSTGKDFLAINPKGAVPVLQLKNGEFLTENAVILQYLADESKATHLLPKIGDLNRYRVLEWLNYITTELHKGFGALFNPTVPAEIKEQIFIPLIKAKLGYVDNHLQNSPYLIGDHFTLPDAYLFVMLRWSNYFNIDIKAQSHLWRYLTELNQRKSIQASLIQEK